MGLKERKAESMRGIKAGGRSQPGFSSAPKQGQRTHCGLAQRALALPCLLCPPLS